MQFGLMLPHFGRFADGERIVAAARAAERAGFHSVWVRDHLVYHPHEFEDPDPKFLDPFTTLAAVAGAVPALAVGTAVAIPVRHPLAIAQSFLGLSQYARAGVIAGIGGGQYAHEFAAVGYPFEARLQILKDFAEILRRAFQGQVFSYKGGVFPVHDVHVQPGAARPIPILIGGMSPAVIRLAARNDGWLPGRITFRTLERGLRKIRAIREEAGLDAPIVGAMPLVSIGDTREEAYRPLDMPVLLDRVNRSRHMARPISGAFERPQDLEGMLLAGTGDDILEAIVRYEALGARFLIFDLRLRFGELEECLARLGREVVRRYGGGT